MSESKACEVFQSVLTGKTGRKWTRRHFFGAPGRRAYGTTREEYDAFVDSNKTRVPFPNSSTFYHGAFMKMVRECTDESKGADALLISEERSCKARFAELFPHWTPTTTNIVGDVDVIADLCYPDARNKWFDGVQFDVIFHQATFEHIIDPVAMMRNMIDMLKPGGHLIIHTHPAVAPTAPFHGYPYDYIRYQDTWFIDVPAYIGGATCLRTFTIGTNIFALICKDT